jgi:mRNA interferase RelE/StbE
MFSVRLLPSAARAYQQTNASLARKIARCFKQLERDPRDHPMIRSLRGPLAGSYRYRVGDHRVVYRIDDDAKIVVITSIAHRKDVYDQ